MFGAQTIRLVANVWIQTASVWVRMAGQGGYEEGSVFGVRCPDDSPGGPENSGSGSRPQASGFGWPGKEVISLLSY